MSENKKYYVTMTDKFMSGWGMANGKKNKIIFICDNYVDALTVAENAKNRTDQKHVNICLTKPKLYRSTFGKDYTLESYTKYYVQIKTKEDYPSWYEKSYFSK